MEQNTAQAQRRHGETETLVEYYDRLAGRYDEERFGNSYGQYLDAQERRLLRCWLAPFQQGRILDLACGTGRLLDLASHGLDASAAMVRIAQQKHPGKQIRCGLADRLAEFQGGFSAVFCLHLLMHLPPSQIAAVLRASFEQLRPGGIMVFDVPSAVRRKATGFSPQAWHAGTALTPSEVRKLAGPGWSLEGTRGILFFPIHRLPAGLRRFLRPLDDLLGLTPAKRFCSYLFYCLKRES